MYQFIEYSEENRIAWISLNRPDKRNALNDVVVAELRDAFERASNSPHAKVVVLRGNGPAFCAGADLEYLQRMQGFTLDQNLADSSALADLMLSIYKLPKVVIALVQGPAVAGGCGLVSVCDFAFATPDSTFGYTEVRIGFVPAIVMAFLLRKAGETRAKELMLSGMLISASKAMSYNLITDVLPEADIEEAVKTFCEKLNTQNSAASMAFTKKMIADIQDLPLDAAIKFAARMNAHARNSEDCKRGVAAFLDKEPLTW